MIANQAGALAAALASSAASVQALGFYRIPPFLLPIYKAAAAQYGVPWQILAAINEIETNYGSDQSVSTAGAVGWMQFMPATWLQYGVDALNAGYADPYNPVDAIFAAARYLRAAGAATDLHARDPRLQPLRGIRQLGAAAGQADLDLPPFGRRRSHRADRRAPARQRQAPRLGGAAALAILGDRGRGCGASAEPGQGRSGHAGASPDARLGRSPARRAPPRARGQRRLRAKEPPLQLLDLMSSPSATVVAVQDGRIVRIGETRELGKYVILRDVYGDVFTYAGLGSIAPTYTLPHSASSARETPAATIAEHA